MISNIFKGIIVQARREEERTEVLLLAHNSETVCSIEELDCDWLEKIESIITVKCLSCLMWQHFISQTALNRLKVTVGPAISYMS